MHKNIWESFVTTPRYQNFRTKCKQNNLTEIFRTTDRDIYMSMMFMLTENNRNPLGCCSSSGCYEIRFK